MGCFRTQSNSFYHTMPAQRSNSISKTETSKQKAERNRKYQQSHTKTSLMFNRTETAFLKKSRHKNAIFKQPPHSIFPFIEEYFSPIHLKQSEHFRACALSHHERSKPFFSDDILEFFMITPERASNFCLRIHNKTGGIVKMTFHSQNAQISL